MTTYRLFVDECGTHNLKNFSDPNDRHLSLTGIILPLTHAQGQFTTQWEALKEKHFGHHNERPILLHRKELIARNIPPFDALMNDAKKLAFNADLLGFIATQQYAIFTVERVKPDIRLVRSVIQIFSASLKTSCNLRVVSHNFNDSSDTLLLMAKD